MPFESIPNLPLVAGVALVFVLLAVARRIPVLRTIVSIVTWVALIGLVAVVLGQRERFDPYVSRVAAMLDLQSQSVAGGVTRIRMSPDGHFWVRARIGDVERRMLVDSGATVTALSVKTAAAAGLEVSRPLFPMILNTANGAIQAETTQVPELTMGNVVARDLAAVVSPAFGDTDILGMNFLSRLKSWRVEDGTLILVPHHPQKS